MNSQEPSIALMTCIATLFVPTKGDNSLAELQLNDKAKSQLMVMARDVMVAGNPAFQEVRKRVPMVKLIQQYGPATMHKVLMMLIRDLCMSVNVVRPMTNPQINEAAAFMFDECGDFRLEDYLLMFTMAKRGQLAINGDKGIMDRIDIETVGKMLDAYWQLRNSFARAAQEAEFRSVEDQVKYAPRIEAPQEVEEVKEAMTDWRKLLEPDAEEQERRDREMRERRDRDVANFERLMAVPRFAQRLIDGEQITSDEDLQFYQNHASEIERSIQAITAASKPAKPKSDYPDPHKFRIRTADPNTPPPTLNPDRTV